MWIELIYALTLIASHGASSVPAKNGLRLAKPVILDSVVLLSDVYAWFLIILLNCLMISVKVFSFYFLLHIFCFRFFFSLWLLPKLMSVPSIVISKEANAFSSLSLLSVMSSTVGYSSIFSYCNSCMSESRTCKNFETFSS